MLQLKNLTKSYKNNLALNKINIDFTTGIYGLLGPNGAGKSTMMNLIAGLIPVSSGTITWNGININELGSKYRSIIGYVPQTTGLYNSFNAKQFLLYMCALKDVYQKKSEKQILNDHVDNLLEKVNLQDTKVKKIGAFSGGMQRRISIAQALLGSPELIILDEPTAGLDPNERYRLSNTVADMCTDKIVIWSTHIVSDIESISKHIVMLKKGNLIENIYPNELLENNQKPTLEQLYIYHYGDKSYEYH